MKISIKTILPIILITALLILLNGCLGTVPDDSPGFTPGSITGRIMVPIDCTECQTSDCIPKSNDGVPSHWIPVEGAIVTVVPHATLTDEDGYYTLSNIEPGYYYVITATFGNLVLKDIVEPPGVKAGKTYKAGTANCESTALGLIVEALLDMGLDSEDIELALEIIKENPKFDELVDIICCIIEDCGNVTLICGVDELVQELIDDEPGYTPDDDEPGLTPELESIEITDFFPDPMNLCLSGTGSPDSGTITTMAYYSTGDPVNISTLATYTAVPGGVVSISGNVVTSIGVGSTTITVTYEGETATVTVNVTDCTTLDYITVETDPSPMNLCAAGTGTTETETGTIVTTAHYSDGSFMVVTPDSYTGYNTNIVASVSGVGLVTSGSTVGSTTITVTYEGETATVTVNVTDCTTLDYITVETDPSPMNLCAAGTGTTETETGTIVTTAHYSDGSFMVVTPDSYTGYNTNIVASVSGVGLVTSGSTVGSTTITVTYEGETATVTVNVTDCTTLDYITVETDPSPMNLCAAGTGTTETETGTIVTTAHYSDGSFMVVTPDSYTGYNTNIVASVSGVGLVTSGSTVGSTTITVTYEGETATVTVNVTDCTTLDYITVETDPSPMNLCAAGTGTTETETGTIVTTAHYSDGSFMVVTPDSYTGYNTNIVASVSGVGLVTSGSTVGSTTITVTYEGETATVTVNVTDCTTLDYITVETDPSPMNLCAAGTGTTETETGTIVTTAHYSDGSFMVVTPDSYTGYNTNIVASVSGVGLVTSGSTVGSTTITVTYEGETATVTVNVTDCTPPCISADLSSFSLEIKEGSSWNEYLGSFSPSVKTYSVMATKNASHFRFTVDAECEGEASLYYNWYRGISCTDDWLTGESGYSDPPPSWIPITSGGTYPTDTNDRPVCNKGGNVLFIKVTNAGSTEIYKVYVDRPNP